MESYFKADNNPRWQFPACTKSNNSFNHLLLWPAPVGSFFCFFYLKLSRQEEKRGKESFSYLWRKIPTPSVGKNQDEQPKYEPNYQIMVPWYPTQKAKRGGFPR